MRAFQIGGFFHAFHPDSVRDDLGVDLCCPCADWAASVASRNATAFGRSHQHAPGSGRGSHRNPVIPTTYRPERGWRHHDAEQQWNQHHHKSQRSRADSAEPALRIAVERLRWPQQAFVVWDADHPRRNQAAHACLAFMSAPGFQRLAWGAARDAASDHPSTRRRRVGCDNRVKPRTG